VTRTLAVELAPLKINVNSLAPGMVLTPFNQRAIDDPDPRPSRYRRSSSGVSSSSQP